MPKKQEKRADGRYMVWAELGRDPATGKRIRKAFYGQTQKEAKKKRDDWVESQNKPHSGEIHTLADWADKWFRVYGKGEYSTVAVNSNVIRKLTEAMGDIPLAHIRKSDIQVFANEMESYSFSMVKKIRGITNRIFSDAYADQLIHTNPTLGVQWDYSSKGTHRALLPWERDLIAANWQHHRCGLWAMLMLFAGLRKGEALALQWKSITQDTIHVKNALHFEGNKAVITDTPKTIAGIRDVPILPPLAAALKVSRAGDDEFVCQSINGPMTEAGFRRGWESYIHAMENILNGEPPIQPGRRSDIPKLDIDGNLVPRKEFSIRTHDLRHTFCTMLFEADVDLKTAQYLMGHADSEMTLKVYTHLSETKKKSSLEKLHGYMEQWRI